MGSQKGSCAKETGVSALPALPAHWHAYETTAHSQPGLVFLNEETLPDRVAWRRARRSSNNLAENIWGCSGAEHRRVHLPLLPSPAPAVQPSPSTGEPHTQQGKGSVAWGLICSLTVVQHAADWGAQGPRRRDDEEAAGKLEMSALPLAAQLAPTKAREPTAQADWEAQTGEKPNQRGDATSEAGAAQGAQPTGGEHD